MFLLRELGLLPSAKVRPRHLPDRTAKPPAWVKEHTNSHHILAINGVWSVPYSNLKELKPEIYRLKLNPQITGSYSSLRS